MKLMRYWKNSRDMPSIAVISLEIKKTTVRYFLHDWNQPMSAAHAERDLIDGAKWRILFDVSWRRRAQVEISLSSVDLPPQ